MSEELVFDFVIIGGGVAGISAAQYGARANLKTVVLENAVVGGQVLNIFDLENYPGVFPKVNGADFINTMKEQAKSFGAEFHNCSITSIDKIGTKFKIQTTMGTFCSYAVLIATGATHRKLSIPGEQEFSGKGVSYCATCDGPFFRNKRIVVIGGGDSACDEATYLSTLTDNITLIHRRASLRAQKSVAERVLNNPKIKTLFNTIVTEIVGDTKVQKVILKSTENGTISELECDGVFIFVGMIPQTNLVDMLPKDEDGYIKTNEEMQTIIPGMYIAGDIRSKPFRQIVTATSDGAIAAWSAAKYIRELSGEVY